MTGTKDKNLEKIEATKTFSGMPLVSMGLDEARIARRHSRDQNDGACLSISDPTNPSGEIDVIPRRSRSLEDPRPKEGLTVAIALPKVQKHQEQRQLIRNDHQMWDETRIRSRRAGTDRSVCKCLSFVSIAPSECAALPNFEYVKRMQLAFILEVKTATKSAVSCEGGWGRPNSVLLDGLGMVSREDPESSMTKATAPSRGARTLYSCESRMCAVVLL